MLTKQDLLLNPILNQLTKTITENIYYTDQDINSTKITLGMLPLSNTKEINKIFGIPNSKYKPSTILVYKITKKIYKEIWIPRCQQIQTLTVSNQTNLTTAIEIPTNNITTLQNTNNTYQIARDKQKR